MPSLFYGDKLISGGGDGTLLDIIHNDGKIKIIYGIR